MASDPRLFFKLHNGFPEHPKTIELSDKAFRQLIEAWCYCSRNLNDGKLTKPLFARLFSRKTQKELLSIGFVVATENGYEMHDYLEHQQSAKDVEDLRNKRAAAGSKGGKAKANNLASATASASDVPKQTASKSVADTDTDTDLEAEELKSSPSPATPDDAPPDPKPVAYPASFEAFWTAYPRKVGKKAALGAFQKARKLATVQQLCTGAARYAADPNREDAFTAHPTTWLNEGRWDDDPLPDRSVAAFPGRQTHADRTNAAAAAMIAKMNHHDELENPQFQLGAESWI